MLKKLVFLKLNQNNKVTGGNTLELNLTKYCFSSISADLTVPKSISTLVRANYIKFQALKHFSFSIFVKRQILQI